MIFVFRIGSLGDSLVSLPALYQIQKEHSSEEIILITKKSQKNHLNSWDILKYTNIFKKVLWYDEKNIKSIFKMIFKIRQIKEKTTLYYLPPFRTSKQITRDYFMFKHLASINTTIGFKNAQTTLARKNSKGILLKLESEYSRLLNIVLNHNKSFAPTLPLLKPKDIDYTTINKLTSSISSNSILIAIAHGTNMPSKKWELDNFQKLITLLNSTLENLFFIVLGGKEDKLEGKYLEEKNHNCLNLSGETSIIESAALLEKCNLFIGNDTGTMHLASVMGTPTIGIFSARDNLGKWEPYGDNNTIIRKNIECEGCMLIECIEKDNKCIKMIDVNEVYQTSLEYLNDY